MRCPRPRFTVRRLMLVVAVLPAREERGRRRELAGCMASEEEARRLSIVLRAKDRELADLWAPTVPDYRKPVEEVRAIVAHHAGLRRKYEGAVACPWEPVARDPDEPRETFRWECGADALPTEPLPPGRRWSSAVEDGDLLRRTALARRRRSRSAFGPSGRHPAREVLIEPDPWARDDGGIRNR